MEIKNKRKIRTFKKIKTIIYLKENEKIGPIKVTLIKN